MNVESMAFGQTATLPAPRGYEANVINEHEIKSILYLGIRGLPERTVGAGSAQGQEHKVDTFV